MSVAARAVTGLAIATGAVLAVGAVSPAQAMRPADPGQQCVRPAGAHDDARGTGAHREPASMHVSRSDQARIERRMHARVTRQGLAQLAAGAEIPVYVHVMLDDDVNGNVTLRQTDAKITVLKMTLHCC